METAVARVERIIGNYEGKNQGKLFIVVAGMHGNETTGVIALQRIFGYLHDASPDFNGKFVGLSGNLEAIEQNQRFIHTDFNRIWAEDHVEKTKSLNIDALLTNEERQQKLLMSEIEEIATGYQPQDVVFVDLHNTSSSHGYFTFTFSGKTNLKIAAAIHVPTITGLQKTLSGTAIEYFSNRGFASVAFEGGQIDDETGIEVHEAGIWLLLEIAGCINRSDIPNYENCRQKLCEIAEDFPKLTDLIYVHHIEPKDNFKMMPGFKNFQPIEKGQLLGHDARGEVRAPKNGCILMPLYQQQGDEGFFIIKVIEH